MQDRVLPEIDGELCDGCGACVSSCPTGALAVYEGKAVLARPWLCEHDGKCEIACPQNAIAVPYAIVFGDNSQIV